MPAMPPGLHCRRLRRRCSCLAPTRPSCRIPGDSSGAGCAPCWLGAAAGFLLPHRVPLDGQVRARFDDHLDAPTRVYARPLDRPVSAPDRRPAVRTAAARTRRGGGCAPFGTFMRRQHGRQRHLVVAVALTPTSTGMSCASRGDPPRPNGRVAALARPRLRPTAGAPYVWIRRASPRCTAPNRKSAAWLPWRSCRRCCWLACRRWRTASLQPPRRRAHERSCARPGPTVGRPRGAGRFHADPAAGQEPVPSTAARTCCVRSTRPCWPHHRSALRQAAHSRRPRQRGVPGQGRAGGIWLSCRGRRVLLRRELASLQPADIAPAGGPGAGPSIT